MFIEPLERHPTSRRFKIIAAVVFAIILFLLIMYNETPLSKGKPVFYIPSSSVNAVAESLQENGYELNSIDHLVLRFVHLPEEGWYRVCGNEVGRYFFFKNLHKKRVRTLSIKIFAGETKREIFHRLSRDLMLDETMLDGNYTKLARFEEGNILAGRYSFPRSADEETVIRSLLKQSDRALDRFAREYYGFSFTAEQLKEALIVASIIQKESNDPDEMARISSVIYNRLKKGMRLQMDGTLNYGKYSRTIVTPERIRSDKSRYNTYKYKGLVPAPLGSVSIEALRAAASPQESGYLFFVLNEKGKHNFAETYKQHIKNVKAFKIYCSQRNEKKKEKEKKKTVAPAKREKKALVAPRKKEVSVKKPVSIKSQERNQTKKKQESRREPLPKKKKQEKRKELPLPKKKQDIKSLFEHIDTTPSH